MRRSILSGLLGLCVMATPLFVGMGTNQAAAGASTPQPTVVAVTGCDDNYTAAFGDEYNVRIDLDLSNMPSSTDDGTYQGFTFVSNTLYFESTVGENPDEVEPISIDVENGSAQIYSFLNESTAFALTFKVEYKAPNGAEVFTAPVTVEVPPMSICGTANVTTVSSPPGGVTAPIVATAPTPDGHGYWLVGSDGRIYAYGDASLFTMRGSGADFMPLNKPIVGVAVTPGGKGLWLVGADGGIFAFGDAQFYGSTGAMTLNKPIVGMAATPDGGGYWLVASDGGVFAFGDAAFFGSMGGKTLNKPVVGIAADNATGGYWLVASDGGIFSFNASFHGSTGALTLNRPIVGMEAASNGEGYRFVASDGGVFCFGVPFAGSTGNIKLNEPITGIAPSGSGGYWLAAQDGGLFSFGAQFYGSPA